MPMTAESLSGYDFNFPWAWYKTDSNLKLLVVCPGRLIIVEVYEVLNGGHSDNMYRDMLPVVGMALKKTPLSRLWS